MPDVEIVLGLLCLMTAAWGFGFTAGRNHEKRLARFAQLMRQRYER